MAVDDRLTSGGPKHGSIMNVTYQGFLEPFLINVLVAGKGFQVRCDTSYLRIGASCLGVVQ
jgi:hypothetical protein